MRKILKLGIYMTFVSLVTANIYIFVSSMNISQKINKLDLETKKLRQDNVELEKQLYNENSLQFAELLAKDLNFTQKAEPYYLENLGFAKKE